MVFCRSPDLLDEIHAMPRELRHSFVSILSDAGSPVKEISHLVGHRGTTVTESVYHHQLRPLVQTGATILPSSSRVRIRRTMVGTCCPATAWVCSRPVLTPPLGRLMIGQYKKVPRDDLLTEARAEEAFDSRAVLRRIRGPVLLIRGDRDQFFTRDVVEETAALIAGCSLIWYAGRGHMKTPPAGLVASDVLAFAARS